MDIKGIDHFAINTKDFKKSIEFYRDKLGFEELNTVCQPEFDSVYLRLPGGGRLEVFNNKGKTKDVQTDDLNAGVKHIAFSVNDVARHEKLLAEKGIEVFLKTTELEDFNARILLFYDPDGTVLEFCEPLK